MGGGADDDVVNGGAGDDVLRGGAGSDLCDGGSGTGDTATASCETVANIP